MGAGRLLSPIVSNTARGFFREGVPGGFVTPADRATALPLRSSPVSSQTFAPYFFSCCSLFAYNSNCPCQKKSNAH
jgi:hypothetical protein